MRLTGYYDLADGFSETALALREKGRFRHQLHRTVSLQ